MRVVSIDRILVFRRQLQQGAAERTVPTAHGVAYLSDSIPDVYDHNYLSVESASVSAAELALETEDALAARFHRRLILEHGSAPGLQSEFADLRYTLSTHLVFMHERAPDRLVDTAAVVEVGIEDLAAARTRAILGEPWGARDIAEQLNEAKRHIAAAVPTRFFAVRVGGEIAGWCEVRSRDGTAQIEDVEVVEEHRGHGWGRVVVQHALREASRSSDVVFLEALADDWPRELYAKLGFVAVGRRDVYSRLPHPLTRLRLRTPRLELRLATLAELHRLYRVAADGIHDPAEMPFEVPWTDDLDEERFVAHHVESLAKSTPDDWVINLVAFHDHRPIGIQALRAQRFRETRVVDTGSWLGAGFQGRGLGTEMRSAALSLAFVHLGARRATSGAIEGNPQSLGVSRRLGYVEIGSHEVSPRGVPVQHLDLEVDPERFRPAAETEVLGLETALPFLGLA